MPNPAMGLTEADLTPAQSTGTRLGSALGGLARVGMQDRFAFNQRALAAAYEQQEAERRRIAQERKQQGMADVLGLGAGALTLGLGGAPALAALAAGGVGSLAGASPHSLVTSGVGAVGSEMDRTRARDELAALLGRR